MGKVSNKAITLWAKEHTEEVAAFKEELRGMYNFFARAYELEPIK